MRPSLAALAALLSPALAAGQIPLGPPFLVNTYTTSWQAAPSVAADGAGNFVVGWQSYMQDGSYYGVFARRYLASGPPMGPAEFRVNGFTPDYQSLPSVAADPSGRFVVAWQSFGQDGDRWGVFARRYDAAGTPGPELRVNQQTTDEQLLPRVAMDGSGNFVVVWTNQPQFTPTGDIFARRYDAAGVAQGGEFQVNTYTTGHQRYAAVAMDAAGNFVVAWTSEGQDGSSDGIFARRYDATGAPLGAEFRVNAVTSGTQTNAVLATNAAGELVVIWHGSDADGFGVFGRRFSASGPALGGDFPVNQYATGHQLSAAVSLDRAANFVVAWDGPFGADGSAILARVYDASGAPRSPEFQVNTFTTDIQRASAVAAQPGGRFVVAWSSNAEDGGNYGVFARRFATDFLSRDGFESGDLSGWSSAATDGGDLSVSATAAMKFTIAGLQATVDDTAGLFVEDALPDDEDRYRARFWVDPNGFDPGEAQNHRRTRLFIAFEEAPNRRLAAIVLRRVSGAYALMARARLDDDTQYDTGFFPIDDGPHSVELAWSRASTPDAHDGSLELWIDGVSVHAVSKLDNRLSAVDFVRMGALSVKAGAIGTLYFDEFESRRTSPIGP